jgi:hypothetical protein
MSNVIFGIYVDMWLEVTVKSNRCSAPTLYEATG